jgi:hypothetical protein
MKLTKQLKSSFLLLVCFFGFITATETVLKKSTQEQDTKCENSCEVCQRVVYQLKFQGLADCEISGVCKNTCYKIKETWGTPWNPFEPFLKDMFGKCEICFRAGHCTISQCKEQEHNEIEVINSVINARHLTAKVNPELLVSFPDGSASLDAKALPHAIKVNQSVRNTISKSIKDSLAIKSTDNLVPQVQNLMANYFTKPNSAVSGNAFHVLNNNPTPSPTVSASDVKFWNENPQNPNQAIAPIAQHAKDAIQHLNSQINLIKNMKQGAKKVEKKQLKKVEQKAIKQVEKTQKKFQKVEKQLDKKAKEITKLIKSAQANPQVAQTLEQSLKKVQSYKTEVKAVQQQLKDQKKKIAIAVAN